MVTRHSDNYCYVQWSAMSWKVKYLHKLSHCETCLQLDCCLHDKQLQLSMAWLWQGGDLKEWRGSRDLFNFGYVTYHWRYIIFQMKIVILPTIQHFTSLHKYSANPHQHFYKQTLKIIVMLEKNYYGGYCHESVKFQSCIIKHTVFSGRLTKLIFHSRVVWLVSKAFLVFY